MKSTCLLVLLIAILAAPEVTAQLSGQFSPSGPYTGVKDGRHNGILVYPEKNFRGKPRAIRAGDTKSNLVIGSIRVHGGFQARVTMNYGGSQIFLSDVADATYPITSIKAEIGNRYRGAILYSAENQQGAAWYIPANVTFNSNHAAWYPHYPHPNFPKSVKIKGRAVVTAVGASNSRELTTGTYSYPSGIREIRVIR